MIESECRLAYGELRTNSPIIDTLSEVVAEEKDVIALQVIQRTEHGVIGEAG